MGVVDLTPDASSDGGRGPAAGPAVGHGRALVGAGADYVAVAGADTRPGAARDDEAETARVVPVVGELTAAGVAVVVDTSRARVAEAAVRAGAVLVHDVSGGRADPAMVGVVAAAGVPWVLGPGRVHRRGTDAAADAGDTVRAVRDALLARVDAALAAGVAQEQLVLDPGVGCTERPRHDLALLAHLDELVAVGFPLLVGVPGPFSPGAVRGPRPAEERGPDPLAGTVLAAQAGAWGVRVHDVGASADAVRLLTALGQAR
jgi:dihydropteroate synthase